MNTLWDNGIQDDSLYFIYLLGKKAHITINTPLGRTDPFVYSDSRKLGCIWEFIEISPL